MLLLLCLCLLDVFWCLPGELARAPPVAHCPDPSLLTGKRGLSNGTHEVADPTARAGAATRDDDAYRQHVWHRGGGVERSVLRCASSLLYVVAQMLLPRQRGSERLQEYVHTAAAGDGGGCVQRRLFVWISTPHHRHVCVIV